MKKRNALSVCVHIISIPTNPFLQEVRVVMKDTEGSAKVVKSVSDDPKKSKLKTWKLDPESSSNGGVIVYDIKKLRQRSGVFITDYVIGNGAIPKLGSRIMITYEGLFPDGRVFDFCRKKKKPFIFRKGLREVIRGLDMGISTMRIGGSREIYIPSDLG